MNPTTFVATFAIITLLAWPASAHSPDANQELLEVTNQLIELVQRLGEDQSNQTQAITELQERVQLHSTILPRFDQTFSFGFNGIQMINTVALDIAALAVTAGVVAETAGALAVIANAQILCSLESGPQRPSNESCRELSDNQNSLSPALKAAIGKMEEEQAATLESLDQLQDHLNNLPNEANNWNLKE